MREQSIVVLGDTHNAWMTAACLSSLGHRLTLVAEAPPPIVEKEPGALDLLAHYPVTLVTPQWHLFDVPDGITEARFSLRGQRFDYAWVALDTPLDKTGAPDVSPLHRMVDAARYLSEHIVVSSQVPLGFCERLVHGFPLFQSTCKPGTVTSGCLCPTCSAYRGYKRWSIAYVPENMRIGDAARTFLRPDRVVVGATSLEYAQEVASIFDESVPPILTTLATAEMIKHATNVFLATSISFANEIAMIAQIFGVEMDVVTRALREDHRIGPKAYVEAGRPFTGGTLKRDLRALQSGFGKTPTPLIDAVLAVNDHMESK
jgi:UDPglucose 6-dehydrogenase